MNGLHDMRDRMEHVIGGFEHESLQAGVVNRVPVGHFVVQHVVDVLDLLEESPVGNGDGCLRVISYDVQERSVHVRMPRGFDPFEGDAFEEFDRVEKNNHKYSFNELFFSTKRDPRRI